MNNELLNLIKKYNIKIIDPNKYDESYFTALGMGDLLISFKLILKKQIQPPLLINLLWFNSQIWFNNPLNKLEFIIKLIENLIETNNLNSDIVQYVFSENQYLESV